MISMERTAERHSPGQTDTSQTGCSKNDTIPPRSRLRLPGHSFKGYDEYQQFRKSAETLFENRWLYEQSLASTADVITIDGTCGVCLRPAQFIAQTAYGEIVKGGRVPNWREELACDCERALISRERAVLHFLRAAGALRPWMRLLVFGDAGSLLTPLSAETAEVINVRHIEAAPQSAGYRLPVADAQCHIALSLDALQRVPPLRAALAEVARSLAPGGRFVFTVPFHADVLQTTTSSVAYSRAEASLPSEWTAPVHTIGWDVLDMLRDAGFVDPVSFLYWAEELGYMGPRNFIFSASK